MIGFRDDDGVSIVSEEKSLTPAVHTRSRFEGNTSKNSYVFYRKLWFLEPFSISFFLCGGPVQILRMNNHTCRR